MVTKDVSTGRLMVTIIVAIIAGGHSVTNAEAIPVKITRAVGIVAVGVLL
jgi:hypothetical protein